MNANILYFQLFDRKLNLFNWTQTFFIYNYSILNRICSVECKHSLFSNIQFWIEFVQMNANILYFQMFNYESICSIECKHSLFSNIQFKIEFVQLNANTLYFQIFNFELNLFNWMQTFFISNYSILNWICSIECKHSLFPIIRS